MTEPVNVTLDIASYGMPVSEFIDWIRDGLGGEFTKVADDIEEQLKPVIEEPKEFGSMVQARWVDAPDHIPPLPWIYTPWHGEHYWRSGDGLTAVWSELRDVEVLRIGLGNETRWREIYDHATKNTRERLYNRIGRLKPRLITAPEQTAIDKALAQIEADVEDHEGPVYHS